MDNKNYSVKIEIPSKKLRIQRPLVSLLALTYTGLVALTFPSLLVAYLIRMRSADSIGVMLPISGFMTGIGVVITILGWVLVRLNRRNSRISTFLKMGALKPRIAKYITVGLFQITLGMLLIIFVLNTRLLGRAFIGITPAIFLIFSLSLSSLVLLVSRKPEFTQPFRNYQQISLQETLLVIISIISFGIVGFLLSNKVFPLLSGLLGISGTSQVLISLFKSIFTYVFVNIILLVINSLPYRTEWVTTIFRILRSYNHAKQQTLKTKFIFRHPAWLAFSITTLFFILFLAVIQPGYDTNDDIGMISILSGYFGGHPFEFPVFSNVILGHLFSSLFKIRNDLNWVVYFYLLVNFFSMWSLVFCLLNLRRTTLLKIIFIVFTLLLNSYFITTINFTTFAAMSSLSGICLIITSLKSKLKTIVIPLILGVLLINIGSLIRTMAMLLVVVVFLPFLLINIKKLFSSRAVVVLLTTAVLIVGCYTYDHLYLQANPEWNNYYRYNLTRAQMLDTPRISSVPIDSKIFDSVSWSPSTVLLAQNFIFLDEQIYSEQNYQVLIEKTSTWRSDFASILEPMVKIFTTHSGVDFLLLASASWIILLLSIKSKRLLFSLLVTILTLTSIIFFLAWGYKLEDRVILPLLMSFSVLMLFSIDWTEIDDEIQLKIPRSTLLIKSSMIVLLVSICLAFWPLFSRPYHYSKRYHGINNSYNSWMTELSSLMDQGVISPDALILSLGMGFPLNSMNVYHIEYPPVKILMSGWNTFSPAYGLELNQHGFDHISDALIGGDDIYFITRPRLIPNIISFYKENYDKKIISSIIYVFGKPDVMHLENTDLAIFQLYEE